MHIKYRSVLNKIFALEGQIAWPRSPHTGVSIRISNVGAGVSLWCSVFTYVGLSYVPLRCYVLFYVTHYCSIGLLYSGVVNCSAVLSYVFFSVLLCCSVSFYVVLYSSLFSAVVLCSLVIFYIVLHCSVSSCVICCSSLCPVLFYVIFDCFMLLYLGLWLCQNIYDTLTLHQKSRRWTKFKNLRIMKEIQDSSCNVALTRR
jgi:hypothetical protein